MAQINLEIPDELLQQLTQGGRTPAEILQEQLLNLAGDFGTSSLSQQFEQLAAQWRQETGLGRDRADRV